MLAETSLLLQSSKLPSVATRNKKQPISLVSATRSVIKVNLGIESVLIRSGVASKLSNRCIYYTQAGTTRVHSPG